MVVVTVLGEDVPVLFPVDDYRVAEVSAFRLGLRFDLKPQSIHVDEEIFLSDSGLLNYTIVHIPVTVGEDVVWNLKQGKYMAYGVRTFDRIPSKDRVTFNRSSSSSFRTPSPSHVKIEPSVDNVTLLSSDSDPNSPEVIANVDTPSVVPTLPIHTTPQHVPSERSHIQDKPISSIIECLKGLRQLKGSRNVLSKIDYNAIDIHTVHVLPPSFNGDVIFELPAVHTCNISSQAKQMAGMDKRYDGHVWTKTKTTNIVNRSGLTFRTSVCVGYVRCMNGSCAFLNRVHQVHYVNEFE